MELVIFQFFGVWILATLIGGCVLFAVDDLVFSSYNNSFMSRLLKGVATCMFMMCVVFILVAIGFAIVSVSVNLFNKF